MFCNASCCPGTGRPATLPQLFRQSQSCCTAFSCPDDGSLLLQPTNHLDLEACVWLEETLKNFKRILLLVSHSQDFMVRASCWLMLSGGKGQDGSRPH